MAKFSKVKYNGGVVQRIVANTPQMSYRFP